MSGGRDTHMMHQWREMKARCPDAILLFRCGDFYEMFNDDAETASRVLGLTLTSRNNGGAADVPLAGVPVRAVDEYLRRLVRLGYRVAICEQVEDPRAAKGIVRREVIETVTPGAAFADDILDGARSNYVAAIRVDGAWVGLAAADLSTGELRLAVAARADARVVLARWAPRELLVPRGGEAPGAPLAPAAGDGVLLTEREGWEFDPGLARTDLARQFGVRTLDGFGIGSDADPAVGAAGALLRYLRELQPGGVPHITRPVLEPTGTTMPLDEMTRRNLEIVAPLHPHTVSDDTAGTLLGVLDRTCTAMGRRLLRQWLQAPLVDRVAIEARLDAVAAFVAGPLARATLTEALDGVRDLERLGSKAAAARATPRELRALGDSLARLPAVEAACRAVVREGVATGVLADLLARWDACAGVHADIVAHLVDRPPTAVGEEATIRPGVDAELDALRALCTGARDAIARIQALERARTGIASLKVGYTRVFGYYIEVTNAHRHAIPADYQRRQTLAGAERYVTPALKEYESQVLTASEQIEARERALFEAVRARAGAEIRRIQGAAAVIAALDVLAALAGVAEREGYTRPEVHDGFALEIVAGRHPVVERMMPREQFIPNDVELTADARLVILTGPNMAGKSTILRQIGLIVLLAQVGSFVPAARARMGIVDRLFTRVGASDNLVRGQSTFMVEMAETSAILHAATRRSLVLLDEIGRGTSTYDGVSIAWAVIEHLHERIGCKAVFATHYHELTVLPETLVACCNYNVAVREVGDQVVFLHRLQPGGADRSYGIEVGRLAGLPAPVLARATAVLAELEVRARPSGREPTAQASLGLGAVERPSAPHPAVERLRLVDPTTLTPIEALLLVDELTRAVARGP